VGTRSPTRVVRNVPPAPGMTDRRSDPVRVHFYRAVVSHMDVWRLRLDATTNRAAVTVTGMITFSFSTLTAPHYVLLLALVFQFVFLPMESRRYQPFDLWRQRFRALNRALIVPALDDADRRDDRAHRRHARLGDPQTAAAALAAARHHARRR
jgi:uncharacterized membrane protein